MSYAHRIAPVITVMVFLGSLPDGLHAAEDPGPRFQREFISIDADLRALSDGLISSSTGDFRERFALARQTMAENPIRAGALLRILLKRAKSRNTRALIHLEIARADSQGGGPQSAMGHFVRAAELTEQNHILTAAVEGFLRLAKDAPTVRELPPVQKYVDALLPLDRIARETVYELGKLLLKSNPARALEVLAHLDEQASPPDPEARRARYLLGVARIKLGDLAGARGEFRLAAEVPPFMNAPDSARDIHVRDLAWLAVGRLAFEAEDPGEAMHAYHQIDIHSPRFGQAFYELGWLAMENGQNVAAMHAFAPLAQLDPDGDLGRSAELLEGHVMLERGEYDAAESHYTSLARRFEGELLAFDRSIAAIADPTALVRNCDTRTAALADPQLQPIVEHPEVDLARRMTIALEEAIALGPLLERESKLVSAIVAGNGEPNLFEQLSADRTRVLDLLERLQEVSMLVDGLAMASHRWLADTNDEKPKTDPCCNEPRLKLREFRELGESLLHLVDARTEHTRDELDALTRGLNDLTQKHSGLVVSLESEIQDAQREAVEFAIEVRRQQLRTMVLEGDSGALEAVWRFKDDHRQRIGEAEQARKRKLDALYEGYAESVGLWDGP